MISRKGKEEEDEDVGELIEKYVASCFTPVRLMINIDRLDRHTTENTAFVNWTHCRVTRATN